MRKYECKNEMIRNFRQQDGSLNEPVIAKVAAIEASEFLGVAIGINPSLGWIRMEHGELMFLFNKGCYKMIHEEVQDIYGSLKKLKELEGMYFALEDPEVCALYFQVFLSSLNLMIFTAETMVVLNGGDVDDYE